MVPARGILADVSFGGSDEENPELKKLIADVTENEDEFGPWEKLVAAAETLEGGLNRNSSPNSIEFVRTIYDRFLAKFPLFFGYWKKYADLEFSIAGTEAAEMIYERGVASVTNSVDLWTHYCGFKVDTCHDPEVIRELFERGAQCVGLDFLSHPFWDKYIEFEERAEAQDRICTILGRIIHIPMHQYARYFERFRHMGPSRPVGELVPAENLAQFQSEVAAEHPGKINDLEFERFLRARIDNYHLEVFHTTQNETTKRWTYEQEIKRPYFHVTELDEPQLANWRKYLDFEDANGDYARTTFLYERCLVTCAHYDEFWLRYARWMLAQPGKEEEVRNIYQRASCLYVPISSPSVRLLWAHFEEMTGRVDVARDIHQSILYNSPGHIDTIVSWANLERRQSGIDAAIQHLETFVDSKDCDVYVQGSLVAEQARLLWRSKGSVEEARQLFQNKHPWYPDVRYFWVSYLEFEINQPSNLQTEKEAYARIKRVFDLIRTKSRLDTGIIKEIAHTYMSYLDERGDRAAMKEYMELDKDMNGPFNFQSPDKARVADDGKDSTVQRRPGQENGQPGENAYSKYYQHQSEQPANGQAWSPQVDTNAGLTVQDFH